MLLRSAVLAVLSVAVGSTADGQLERRSFMMPEPAVVRPTAVVSGRVDGRFPTILRMWRVGLAAQLADGRMEERFTVQANVPFVLSSVGVRSNEIRVADNAAEISLSDFVGVPGYHAEIVVRAPREALVNLSLQPGAAPNHQATRAAAARSGS